MKRIILAALILISAFVNAQNVDSKDVPSAIKSKFESLYPDTKDAKWGKVVFNYEAEFNINGVETSVLFDVKGLVLETNSEFKIAELPKPITDYISKNFGWKKIREAVKVVDGNGRTQFRLGVGVKELQLVFDYQGNFLRQVKM